MRFPRESRPRGAHRSSEGTRGYRGIILVLVVIALIAVGAVTGQAQRAWCAVDSSMCTAPTATSAPTRTDQLPAASDELAVRTGAGYGALPAGYQPFVAGQQPRVPSGAVPGSDQLWEDAAQGHIRGQDAALLTIDSLPCGTAQTGPCDAWSSLASDSTADQSQGASRLGVAGLDPFVGQESETTTIDLTLQTDPAAGASGRPTTYYRSAERLRDGASTSIWAWSDESSTYKLTVERSGEGLLHSWTLVTVSQEDGATMWRTLSIPVSDTSRDALEAWLDGFLAGTVVPASQDTAPVEPVDSTAQPVARLAYTTGSVTALTVTAGAADPSAVTPQAMVDAADPTALGLSVSATQTLGPIGEDGTRAFADGAGS